MGQPELRKVQKVGQPAAYLYFVNPWLLGRRLGSKVEGPHKVSKNETGQAGKAQGLDQGVAKARVGADILCIFVIEVEQQGTEHDTVKNRACQNCFRRHNSRFGILISSKCDRRGGYRDEYLTDSNVVLQVLGER